MRDLFTAKWSHVTRTVPDLGRCRLGGPSMSLRLGDLVVTRVIRVGAHEHLEDAHGRRVKLHKGDLVVGACGNRYATDFYEGYYRPGPKAHLLTAGGVIGTAVSWHTSCPAPTELEILGPLTDANDQSMSLEHFARPKPPSPPQSLSSTEPLAVAVVGSSMNSGKTTTAAD